MTVTISHRSMLAACWLGLSMSANALSAQPKPDPNPGRTTILGLWRTNEDEVVRITNGFDGVTPGMPFIATFVVGGACPSVQRWYYVKGEVTAIGRFEGKMLRCNPQILIEKCGQPPTWEAKFTANLLDKDHITGSREYQEFIWDGPNQANCRRNPAKDSKRDFTLSRCPPSGCDPTRPGSRPSSACGNIDVVKTAAQQVTRAATVTGMLATWSAQAQKNDPKLATAFKNMNGALANISRVLGAVTDAKKECDNAVQFITELRDFLAAVTEVNSAGCDTEALAKGFDNLTRTAGTLGTRAAKYLPQLGPAFTILSANQNFFQRREGDLNPFKAHNAALSRNPDVIDIIPPCR